MKGVNRKPCKNDNYELSNSNSISYTPQVEQQQQQQQVQTQALAICSNNAGDNVLSSSNAALVDSTQLANQFTNVLNSLEKLNYENNELKIKNKDLLNKIEAQDKAIRELATLINSVGKVNLSLIDLQNWIKFETDKHKALLPNFCETTQLQQEIIVKESCESLQFNDTFNYRKGKIGLLKYLIMALSFCCFIISLFATSCTQNSIIGSIRGFYLCLILGIFSFTLLFWLCMVTGFYKNFSNINWIITDCFWSMCFTILLFIATLLLSINTCGSIALIICMIFSGITCGLLLMNSFCLYTKMKENSLIKFNNKNPIWKKSNNFINTNNINNNIKTENNLNSSQNINNDTNSNNNNNKIKLSKLNNFENYEEILKLIEGAKNNTYINNAFTKI